MLFKLFWKLLSFAKYIIPVAMFALGIYFLYTNFSAIQSSPIALLYPAIKNVQLPQNPFDPKPSEIPQVTALPSQLPVHISTSKGEVTFSAETASTAAARSLGLMYRTSLPAYNGMLFLFEDDVQYNFWMKNCEISLDMIFIDNQKKIVDIIEKAPPCKQIDASQEKCPGYIPKEPYRYTLEINAGMAKTNNLEIGQTVSW